MFEGRFYSVCLCANVRVFLLLFVSAFCVCILYLYTTESAEICLDLCSSGGHFRLQVAGVTVRIDTRCPVRGTDWVRATGATL